MPHKREFSLKVFWSVALAWVFVGEPNHSDQSCAFHPSLMPFGLKFVSAVFSA